MDLEDYLEILGLLSRMPRGKVTGSVCKKLSLIPRSSNTDGLAGWANIPGGTGIYRIMLYYRDLKTK